MIFGRRFGDVIRRQLDLFETAHGDLLADCDAAEQAYITAPRDEAEERYGDYMDAIAAAAEPLESIRDNFAGALDESTRLEYDRAFVRAVGKRFRRLRIEVVD